MPRYQIQETTKFNKPQERPIKNKFNRTNKNIFQPSESTSRKYKPALTILLTLYFSC